MLIPKTETYTTALLPDQVRGRIHNRLDPKGGPIDLRAVVSPLVYTDLDRNSWNIYRRSGVKRVLAVAKVRVWGGGEGGPTQVSLRVSEPRLFGAIPMFWVMGVFIGLLVWLAVSEGMSASAAGYPVGPVITFPLIVIGVLMAWAVYFLISKAELRKSLVQLFELRNPAP